MVVSHDRALLEALTSRTARLHRGELTYHLGRLREGARDLGGRPRRGHGWSGSLRSPGRGARARPSPRHARRGHRRRDPSPAEAGTRVTGTRGSIGAQTKRAWAEARLGADVRRLKTGVERASAAVRLATVDVELGRSVFLGYQPAPRPIILALDEPELRAGSAVLAQDVHVALRREDRIRLAGPNGAGKSTLLRRFHEANPRRAEEVFFLGQEVDNEEGRSILERVRALPADIRGERSRWLPRSEPIRDRLLASAAPSAGEVRKLLLAEGLARRPWAAILDEPTNHLDLTLIDRTAHRRTGRLPGRVAPDPRRCARRRVHDHDLASRPFTALAFVGGCRHDRRTPPPGYILDEHAQVPRSTAHRGGRAH